MPFDLSSLPVSGSFLVGAACYAAASLYAGQIIGERMIDRSGWQETCEEEIRAQVPPPVRRRHELPKTDCSAVVGRFHPELNMLCWRFGNPDPGRAATEAKRQAERARDEVERRRRERILASAPSRCGCAANTYLQTKALPLGLYAGTARAVPVPAVRDQHAVLVRTLNGPICSAAQVTG